ncbi:MAG TPA: bifunctional UDP-sugar hydrolase/5'-nucleotidase [Pseudomonadota bacterium]|nr:bifunctional UDP-sugar hydrolase/5'-nucleotidase [Pseudomonadota bacterium]
MTKLALVLGLIVGVGGVGGCQKPELGGPQPLPPPSPSPEAVKVTLLHFSDYHSHALPYYSEHAPDQGGVARALAYVQRRRAELPNVLVLNGGDMWNSGTPAWSDKYYGDCPEWRWFSEHLGAMAFGNHDVDYGWDALIACRDKVKYPILSGNLVDKDGKLLLTDGGKPYIVKQLGGVRIGAFAVSGADFVRLVAPAHLPPGARFTDPVAAARQIVQTLREVEKVDAVVFFGHQDRESDFAMAKAVPGIDLILGTHSHYKGIMQRIPETQTYFISPFQYLNYLSEVELTFRAGKLGAVTGTLVQMDALLPQDKRIAADVQSLQEALEKDPLYAPRFQVIGSAAVELDSTGIDSGESVLGNFAMDIMRGAVAAHAALTSASSFRAAIPPGPIRLEDYLTALPYKNKILKLQMTGRQLQALLEYSGTKRRSDNFAVTSGVRYTLNVNTVSGIAVVSDPLAKEPKYELLQSDRVYTVATTDYLANVAAGYKEIFDQAQSKTDSGILFNDAVIDFIKSNSPVAARLEGRVIIADGLGLLPPSLPLK